MQTADGIKVYCAHTAIVDTESLVPNPRNPNTHSEKQIKLLAKIILNQGWRNPIVVSNRSGFIVKGHGRLEAAKLMGKAQVPIDRQDYATEADEWADLIADNRIAELSENDNALLKDLLEELDTGAFDLDLTGFDENEIERLMTQHKPDDEIIEDDNQEKPEEEEAAICCPHCQRDFKVFTIKEGKKTKIRIPTHEDDSGLLQ